MKLDCERYRITIEPENEMEEAYLEAVLGLKENGDTCQAKRVNAHDLSCWAYLEIKKGEKFNIKEFTAAIVYNFGKIKMINKFLKDLDNIKRSKILPEADPEDDEIIP